MAEPDFEALMADVKTIKSILQAQDAPFPAVWKAIYGVAAPGILLGGLIKLLVPAVAALDFLATLGWLWTPLFTVMIAAIVLIMRRELPRSGTGFLAQGRVRILIYTRFVVGPAVLTLAYLLSLNPVVSLEGALLVLLAVGMMDIVALLPESFALVPFLFLCGGLAELILNLQGPWWTFANTAGFALTLTWVGLMLQRAEERREA